MKAELHYTYAFKSVIILLCILQIASVQLKAQAPKPVLLEEFTNTYCPNCINAHPDFVENVLLPYQDDLLIHIAYHIGLPVPKDTFFQDNMTQVSQREQYYEVPGTPSAYVNGIHIPNNSGQIVPTAAITDWQGATAPLEINVTEQVNSPNDDSRNLEIKLKPLAPLPNANYKLRVIIVERFISQSPPPFAGMDTTFYNVFRQHLGHWDDFNFSAPPIGVSTTYNFTYTLEEHWQKDQIYAIALIQNNDTKEIVNVASTWGNLLVTNIPTVKADQAFTIQTKQVQNQLVIEQSNYNKPKPIKIYNVLGKLVQTAQIPAQTPTYNLNVASLPSGMYFLQIDTSTATNNTAQAISFIKQ